MDGTPEKRINLTEHGQELAVVFRLAVEILASSHGNGARHKSQGVWEFMFG